MYYLEKHKNKLRGSPAGYTQIEGIYYVCDGQWHRSRSSWYGHGWTNILQKFACQFLKYILGERSDPKFMNKSKLKDRKIISHG